VCAALAATRKNTDNWLREGAEHSKQERDKREILHADADADADAEACSG
jgi:hypothetical protein